MRARASHLRWRSGRGTAPAGRRRAVALVVAAGVSAGLVAAAVSPDGPPPPRVYRDHVVGAGSPPATPAGAAWRPTP